MNKKSNVSMVMISIFFLIGLIVLFFKRDITDEYKNILTMISLISAILVIILMLIECIRITIIEYKRIKHTEEELHSREYSLMREHLEHEISSLQKKLINSGKDWESINHLPLSVQKKEYDDGPVQITNFIKRFGLNENDITIDKKMVFFLTPFSKESMDTYLSTKEICSECGLNLYRGDEEFTHKDILTNIIKYIVQARIIIANIDGKNPNVFYELGIAHSLGKPTILISRTLENTPFDIQQNRIIFFTNSEDLKSKLSKELLRILVEH